MQRLSAEGAALQLEVVMWHDQAARWSGLVVPNMGLGF